MNVATTKLKYLCVDGGQYGLNLPASDYVAEGEGLRLIRTTDLRPDGLLPPEQGIFAPGPVDARFLLDAGDVLVSRAGTVGRSFLTPPEAAGSTFAGFLVRFRPNTATDSRYLNYVLQSTPVQQQIQAEAITSTIQNFNAERYASLTVPCVGLDEQRRIADFLDDQVTLLDQAIQLRQQQVELTKTRMRSLLSRIMSGAADDSAEQFTHAHIGAVDAAWPVLRLKRAVSYAAVGVVVNPSSYFVDEGGVPFIHGGNVREGLFALDGVKRLSSEASDTLHRSRLRTGDVVVVRAGYPGRAAVVPPELEGANCASVLLLRPGANILPAWLETFFNASQGKAQVALVQYGAAQEQINLGDVVEFSIPVPDLAVQERLMADVSARRRDSEKIQALYGTSLDLLQERKQALITAAVTGQFDVTTVKSVA